MIEYVSGIEICMVLVEPSERICGETNHRTIPDYGIGIVIVQPSERTFGDFFKGERSDT